MTVLPELDDLLCVYLELADVLVEAKQILARTLKPESLVVVRERISHLLDIVLIGQEVDQLLIDDQRFLEAVLEQHPLSLDQLRRCLDYLLVVVAQRGVEQLEQF